MTLKEQYDFLAKQASVETCEVSKRKLMECAHSLFDFWQEATEGIKMDFDDDYRVPTVGGKNNPVFKMENTIDTVKKYRR